VIVLLVSLVIMKPEAPEKIILLTGPEGSGYHELGKRYAEYLCEQGLETEVRVTLGGLENAEELAAGARDTVGFAPSNIEHEIDGSVDIDHLVSLGSVAWEPLWLFYRSELEIRRIPDLAGLRVAIGAQGTVVHYVARELLRANGILSDVKIQPFEGETTATVAQALVDGTIDAAFGTGAPKSPVIKNLLTKKAVEVLSFERAGAYAVLNPGVAKIVAPEGVFDLARNVPPEDLSLLSVSTNLVTHDSLYPATVPLLLRAASKVHNRQCFTAADESFPNAANVSLPLNRAAIRYYKQGEKGLSKFLPYKVTRWLNHLGFVVLPLLTLAVVLVKIAPMVLKIWGQLRLGVFLKGLEAVEKEHAAGTVRSKLIAELDLIDQKSITMFVPRSIVHDYIDFRQFLHDMRERVKE